MHALHASILQACKAADMQLKQVKGFFYSYEGLLSFIMTPSRQVLIC